MLGKIVVGDVAPDSIKQLDPSKENVVAHVSTKVTDLTFIFTCVCGGSKVVNKSSLHLLHLKKSICCQYPVARGQWLYRPASKWARMFEAMQLHTVLLFREYYSLNIPP